MASHWLHATQSHPVIAETSYMLESNERKEDHNHCIHIKLFFLSLENPEQAIARVSARVRQGGHFIPDDVVRRRFHAGLKHFKEIYRYEVDLWRWYENSGDVPKLVEAGENS